MLLKIGLIFLCKFHLILGWPGHFLDFLPFLVPLRQRRMHSAPNNRHLISESERKNVTRSDDWEQIRKHINSSPADAKAWQIIRLLVRSTLAIPTPSQMLVSQQQMALIFHIKFSSGFKPSWFGGFTVHMELLIYNMLYCWKNVFEDFLDTSAPGFLCKWVTLKDCINVMLILSQK